MKTRPQRNFSPEFRLEAAQLVVDQNDTVREAADAMSVGYSTMDRWVRQLRQEHNGETSKATPMTPDQLKSYPVTKLCQVFGVHRSSFKYWKQRSKMPVSVTKVKEIAKVKDLFEKSEGSAGARSIAQMTTDQNVPLSRYRAGRKSVG